MSDSKGIVKKTVNKEDNLKKFGIDKPPANPSSEAKKAGWERRRERLKIMDTLNSYMDMTKKQFDALKVDLEKNPSKYTLREALIQQYARKVWNSEKMMVDWLDRNVEKAPTLVDKPDVDGNPISFGFDKLIKEVKQENDTYDTQNENEGRQEDPVV